MRHPRTSPILLICSLGLVACTAPATTQAPPPDQPATQPEPVPDPVKEGETAVDQVAQDPGPEIPALTSSDLLGMEPAEVQNLLGPVSLKRWEGDIQVMQFRNDHCVIDVYFYETAPGEAFEASYLAARTSSGAEIGSDICLASILPGGVWAGDGQQGSGPGQ